MLERAHRLLFMATILLVLNGTFTGSLSKEALPDCFISHRKLVIPWD